jgi:hypothetical protein
MPFDAKRDPHRVQGVTYTPGESGFGKPTAYHWTNRGLPDPGAMSYSFDTLQLPKFSVIGNGVRLTAQWQTSPPNPILFPRQGAVLQAIGSPGVLTGGWYSAPLVDVQGTTLPPELQAALSDANRNYALP